MIQSCHFTIKIKIDFYWFNILWYCWTYFLWPCWTCFISFLPVLVWWEFLLWIGVEFCQMLFFCVSWDKHVVFVMYSHNIVYYLIWFSDVRPPLRSWAISYLVMVYRPFYMLLDSVGWYFVRIFVSHFIIVDTAE